MKRQVIAIALGSLFALPAFANYEQYGDGQAPQAPLSTKSRADVRAELLAAKQSGSWIENSELGTVNRLARPVQFTGKTRDEVRGEVARSRATGDYIVNAELGTTANQL